jgi:hypothetical protein
MVGIGQVLMLYYLYGASLLVLCSRFVAEFLSQSALVPVSISPRLKSTVSFILLERDGTVAVAPDIDLKKCIASSLQLEP